MMNRSAKSNQSKACKAFLCFLDSFLSIAVFSPIVVGYWRGCWQLMDIYLFPDSAFQSMWVSLTIGITFGVVSGLLQDVFQKIFCNQGFSLLFFISSRLYTVVFCVCCVNHWRGVWMAWDFFTGTSWESGAASTGIGLFILGITRGVKNILAPPFVAVPDKKENYFHVPTLFNTKRKHYVSFFVDVVFTVIGTGSLVVFVWRGSWVVLDRKLFPNNAAYSAWGSMVIGITVTVLSFFGQVVMISCLRGISKGVWKTLLEDIYHTVCFVGAVNVWRGVWNLLNIYLYPDRPVLSNAITTVGGNLALILFFCANSTIPIRGAEMDGAKEGAAGIVFRTSFLRSFFQPKKEAPSKPYGYWDEKRLSGPLTGFVDASKNNGLTEGRRIGDGNSLSDSYSEEINPGEEGKPLAETCADVHRGGLSSRNPEPEEIVSTQRESYM